MLQSGNILLHVNSVSEPVSEISLSLEIINRQAKTEERRIDGRRSGRTNLARR